MDRKRSRSGKRKKRQKAEDAVDRISELPDSLISHVFSFLDMKDVVKTCVLSKRWKETWTHVDCIAFHWNSRSYYLPPIMNFLSFMDHTRMALMRHDSCIKIKKFCITGWQLRFIERYKEFFVHFEQCIAEWLKFVFSKNVEILKLELAGFDYVIPDYFYKKSSLVELKIDQLGQQFFDDVWDHDFVDDVSLLDLESEGEYRFYYGRKFDESWNRLKILSLKNMFLPQKFMEDILSNCCMLETLVLKRVVGLSRINITFQSLINLKLQCFYSETADDSRVLEITAPWLKSLELLGEFSCQECNLVDVSSLKYAKLTLGYHDCVPCDEPESVDINWSSMIDKLLEPVCRANELALGAELLQALSLMRMTSKRSLIFESKYLTIHSPICKHEVPGIVCLLESSPNLETLVIRIMPWQCRIFLYESEYIPCNMNSPYIKYGRYADNVFTSFCGIYYLSQQEKKLPCLRNVKIQCVEKSNIRLTEQNCFELELAAYIIRNAEFLEKLEISFSRSNFCRYYAARYLSLLSSKRKIGEKARQWKCKKINSTYLFSFST